MAISKMKKISLFVSKDDSERILRDVVFFKGVETIVPDNEENGVFSFDDVSDKISECEKDISFILSALETIAKYREKKRKLSERTFTRKEFEALESKLPDALEKSNSASQTVKALKALKNDENTLARKIKSLEPWTSLDLPLDTAYTDKTVIERAVLPASCDMKKLDEIFDAHLAYYEKISEDSAGIYILALIPKEAEREIKGELLQTGYSTFVYQSSFTAKKETERINEEIKTNRLKSEELTKELKELALSAGELEEAYDFLNLRLEELKVKKSLLSSRATVQLRGWISERKLEKFEKLTEPFVCYYELEEPSEEDTPPTEMVNAAIVSPFEEVIAMYSYPDYRGIDPTTIMSFFYFVIFGFMLADVGYGITLTLGCIIMMKLMHAKGTFKRYLQLFAICGVSTALAGALFGGYFGDLPSVFSENMLGGGAVNLEVWFNPVQDPITFLVVSVALGAVHLLVGMAVKAYMLIRRGKVLDAIFDIGSWYLVFVGLILWLLLGIDVCKWVTAAGLVSLVLTQGRQEKNIIMKFLKGLLSLYDIVNYVSDLLSYSRILALALASAVVASVVNIMATLFGPTPMGYILMTVILLFGHTLNLALNLLGTFVHTSRLQYIEFFGKFYEDGGIPFKPAAPKLKYTQITEK